MRFLLFAALALILSAGGWFLLGGTSVDPTPSVVGPGSGTPSAGDAEAPPELAEAQARGTARTGLQGSAATPAEVTQAEVLDGEHPWAGAMAGVKGRLLEHDGEPAKGLRLVLMEGDMAAILGQETVARPLDGLDVGEAVTDSGGRFHFDGASGQGLHGLAIDPGGPRATLRFLDQSFAYGEVTDLGDIVMDAYGVVVGVVIDEDGEPVEGARVRLAQIPDIVLQSGILALNPESKVALAEGGSGTEKPMQVLDLPPFAMELEERFPLSTAYTGADGAFRIEGVPAGSVGGGVDLDGFAPTIIDRFELAPGATHDVDEVELLVGRTATGRVVDTAGRPVPGALVHAGAIGPLIPMAFLGKGVTSAEDGTFRVPGVPEMGRVVAATRMSVAELSGPANGRWITAHGTMAQGLTLELPSAAPLRIRVENPEGRPVTDAKIELVHKLPPSGMSVVTPITALTSRDGNFVKTSSPEPGLYLIDNVPEGYLEIYVHAPGLLTGRMKWTHSAETNASGHSEEVRLVLGRGPMLAVTVLDGQTKLAVQGAHVTLLKPTRERFISLGHGWTDAEGLATVGPMPEPESQRLAQWDEAAACIVEHPSYGRVTTMLEDVSLVQPEGTDPAAQGPNVQALTMLVLKNGEVQGQVDWGGAPPEASYMAIVAPAGPGSKVAPLPRFTRTDGEGSFRIAGLEPGPYRIELFVRAFHGNLLALFESPPPTDPVYSESFDVRAGETTELSLSLSADGATPASRLEGSVQLDGQPVAGARIELGQEEIAITDANGRFEAEGVAADRFTSLRIFHSGFEEPEPGDQEEIADQETELFEEYIQVEAGGVTRVTVDLVSLTLTFHCLDDETGLPMEGVTISSPVGGNAASDAAGFAILGSRRSRSRGSKRYSTQSWQFHATANGYESFTLDLDEPPPGETVEIRLRRAVPCSGIVVLSEDERAKVSYRWLRFTRLDENGSPLDDHQGFGSQVEPSTGAFSVDAIGAGTFRVSMWDSQARRDFSTELTVPPGGSTDLVVEFP